MMLVHVTDVSSWGLYSMRTVLNGHQEWLCSTTTNRHGVAALDFATVSGCDQLVIGPTHARGGTLDLLMTDVPDLEWVVVVAPLGRSIILRSR